MKSHHKKSLGAALLMGAFVLRMAGAAVTNTVPWGDSFESYTNGASVIGTNGWSAESLASGVATTNPAVVSLLPAYTNTAPGGFSYPLSSATHTSVLQTTTLVTNDVRSTTGNVVAVEFMALPSAQDSPPVISTNVHYAFFIDTNLNLVIWHQNRSGGSTNNEWRSITNGPTVSTNAWSRFTVLQDYGHNMFQIRVNEGTNAVWDPVGWSSPGGTASGSWFYMVKTNSWLSHVMLGSDVTNYVDDLLLTNRSLTWSTNHFTEVAANDGTIDTNPVFDITLHYDTFAGTNGQLLDANAFTVTNLPAGLTGVVTRLNETRLRLTLTGQTSPNEASNSVTNLTVILNNSAFTLGNATDVAGNSNGTLAIDFMNATGIGSLTFSSTHFVEAETNNGSMSSNLTLSLTGAGVSFTNIATLTAGTHYTITNVPPGLAFSLTRSDANTLVAHLTGKADAHLASNSITNLNLAFLDAAFPGTVASKISGSTNSLAVDFHDPTFLTLSGASFTEAAANNGSIGNSNTITLAGTTFANTTFINNTHYTVTNVPDGLTFNLVHISDTQLVASLSGWANNHLSANSISNLTLNLLDPAFSTVHAANISGLPVIFAVSFTNQPGLTYSGNTFTEASGGLMDNRFPVTITLTGDTFAADAGSHIAVANLPDGLSAAFTRVSSIQLSVSLNGAATSHASTNSITNLTFTFQSGAFANTDVNQVGNYIKNDLRITFIDDVEFFNLIPYGEPFEGYTNSFWLAGTNGWTADFSADAGIVTNDTAVASNLTKYLDFHIAFPIATNHTRMLAVKDNLKTAIHSETNRLVYLDFMAQPVAMLEVPDNNTNVQYAFYVSTNQQLVIWHCNRTGGTPTNEWRTLQNSPLISTSSWVRFTVAQDYTHQMFQVRVNEERPLVDPAGWTDGGAPTGSWFYMVQTNGTMSHFIMSGIGQGYLDDLTVQTSLPALYGAGIGSVYRIR